MSALAINSLLDNQMGSVTNHNFATIFTKPTESTIIDRKNYNGGGGQHYNRYGHSGQSYGQKNKKKGHSIAVTALTLLAFLFFLNILQQCLQEQMDQMNPQVVIMQARIKAAREAEAKEAEKRIGESAEKNNPREKPATVNPVTEDDEHIPSFSKAESLYRYDKVHVPVQLKSMSKRRP